MFSIDSTSCLVHSDVEIPLAEIESRLATKGYALRYFTPPDNGVSLGEALSRRLPNLYSSVYGGIEDLCVRVHWRMKDGRTVHNVLSPRSATGPCLKKLLIGSGDHFGKPVRAVMKVFPFPAMVRLALIAFPSGDRAEGFRSGLQRLRLEVPLLAAMSPEEVSVAKVEEGEILLGTAFWGEAPVTTALAQVLRGMAEGRKGRWVDVEEDKEFQKILKTLRGAAARELSQNLSAFRRDGTRDQDRLLKMLPR